MATHITATKPRKTTIKKLKELRNSNLIYFDETFIKPSTCLFTFCKVLRHNWSNKKSCLGRWSVVLCKNIKSPRTGGQLSLSVLINREPARRIPRPN